MPCVKAGRLLRFGFPIIRGRAGEGEREAQAPAFPSSLATAGEGRREGRGTQGKKKADKVNLSAFLTSGAPGEIRTPDRLVRSQVLYPAELRAREERNYA